MDDGDPVGDDQDVRRRQVDPDLRQAPRLALRQEQHLLLDGTQPFRGLEQPFRDENLRPFGRRRGLRRLLVD